MTNNKQRAWLFFLVALITGASVFWWWSSRPLTVYQTQRLSTGNIESVVAAIGTIKPRESVDVGVQVSGQITRLYVEPGDTVEKGQLLAEVDARVLEAAVESGRAELTMLEAQLEEHLAEVTLSEQKQRRQIWLFKNNSTPEEELQTAQAALAVAQARVKQLQARMQQTRSQLKADKTRLSYSRIYAPMTGTVLSIAVKEGQTLNANYQTPPLLQIADLSTMRVQASVSEADIHRIRRGIPVRFNTLGNTARVWHSEVHQIMPAPSRGDDDSSELLAVTYTVLFDVANSDGALMPGMTTEVDFVVTSASDVTVAPLAALSATTASSELYLAQVLLPNGHAEQRQVTVGRRDRLRAEVLTGVQPGEQLVIDTQNHARRWDSW
jgi:macrolide-specific efflux system membrane fusion protein